MNQKKVFIPLLAIFSVAILGAQSRALALTTLPASNASFRFHQSPNYFLKGSFNSWTPANADMLSDNTASMVAETNKEKEFKIIKNLSKDDELKVWDTTDTWYSQGTDNCSYVDKWGRSTSNGDNYVVPMSDTYTILLKFFSTGAKQVYVSAPDLTTLYLSPNSNWTQANARFAAYFFGTSGSIWVDMTDSNSDGIYEVDIPSGNYGSVIFGRMNPATSDNNFNEGVKWNQTGDLTYNVTGYNNLFTIPAGDWDNSTTTWSSL